MLYIICDCSQVIEVCVKRVSVIMRPELVSKLLFLEDKIIRDESQYYYCMDTWSSRNSV